MEPKRRIPLFRAAVAFVFLAAVSGVVGNRTDAYVTKHWGANVAAVTSWDYMPAFIACIGIMLLWWWSQGAPPERIVERIEYRDPEPTEAARRTAAIAAARTTWKGAVWKWSRGQAIPCCPEADHQEQPLLFVDVRGVVHETMPGTAAWLKCVFADEHPVALDDGIDDESHWVRAVEYDGIAREARTRLRG